MDQGFSLHPEQASSIAGQVDLLYFYLCSVGAFFTLLIFVLIVYFAIKYRRRSEEIPDPIEGSHKLEIFWSVVPLMFAMSFFFWGASLYFKVYRPPENAMEVYVIGKQWMWKLQHPEGVSEINTLHVPVDTPVKLILSSQDVIHSFFVPAFRIKMDVVPGRYSVTWFKATKVGEYRLFCAEYCGTEHSGMIGKVVVMEPEEYQAWLSGSVPNVAPAVAGAQHFHNFGCIQCHASQAPSMSGLFGSQVQLSNGRTVLADEHYLRKSILNSTDDVVAGYQPIMPSFRNQISEEQLVELIAYIKSLANTQAGDATTPAAGMPMNPSIAPATQRSGDPKP